LGRSVTYNIVGTLKETTRHLWFINGGYLRRKIFWLWYNSDYRRIEVTTQQQRLESDLSGLKRELK
jgi:hypothetical protein